MIGFRPRIMNVFKKGYSWEVFLKDLSAGLIVGVVALPLAMAFAIASGLTPQQGLYTAVVAGFLISLFSGSNFQIGGPTGAFVVIVAGVVAKYGYEGLALATIMAGILLIAMGLSKLGAFIKFIPYPVTIGFTSGIALIIIFGQIKDFFGLTTPALPEAFLAKLLILFKSMPTVNMPALLIGFFTIIILKFWPKISYKIPAPLVAIILSSLAVKFFSLPVATIGSRFGDLPFRFPVIHVPNFSWELVGILFPVAISIALLAGIESLLSAVVADGMTGQKHNSDTELVAQGIANIGAIFFFGLPATGAIARTATNIKNGGQTPMAGIIHALTLLLIMLFFSKWTAYIPMATLAGILIVVGYNMGEWPLFRRVLKGTRSDALVLMTTFLLTVLIDLTVAIEVGMVMAAFLFMYRMSAVTEARFVTDNLPSLFDEYPEHIRKYKIPAGVEIFEINGPFFFGAADKFRGAMASIEKMPKVLILRMRHVPSMDMTGLQALDEIVTSYAKKGVKIVLSGVRERPRELILKSGLGDKIGKNNVLPNIQKAILRAAAILKEKK